MLAVMPNDQTPEKERMIRLHGGELMAVDPVPLRTKITSTIRRAVYRKNAMIAGGLTNLKTPVTPGRTTFTPALKYGNKPEAK